MKLELVSYWRKWWKMWSVWLSILGSSLFAFITFAPGEVMEIWNQLPPDMKAHIPENILSWITYGIWILAILSKFIRQQKLTQEVHGK
ncbi:putative holin [Serratia phage vB_SmaS_LittleDog]|uniref:Holin n=2 Tax=Bonzeevirus TaxID=3152507 RepID=A0AC61TQH9_9CAUD|nr:holin [Serratia phage vB_SmaS_Bonzee]YP_010774237.1 putative holin [Serratia phage vB_SmaS_Stoker]YP_010774374.1 putative holin [Serratia phage vB_SmaS_Bigdog]QPX75395.1 putative holin [Serratia phage vB_SmaS_Opt-148]UGO51800.1 putative holin [Serratia phage vB_SmaS_Swain]UGO51864.1 putative holin [Serratia phage vB_SmaS_Carrot]UGO53082.1 putative holin [Serratia phage vB_SmaS_LittleDog]QPX75165.1 putative holin [Serratia phage vB_SmaS_Bigdog]